VLYDALRKDQLISYLAARRTDRGAWTRLSFLLSLRNPYFVSISDLPIDTHATTRNFYLTNRQAHRRGKKMVLLTPGTRVTAAELKPVTGGQLVQPVTPAVEAVQLLDLSGAPVLTEPCCKPVPVLKNGEPVMKGGEPVTEMKCTDRVFLDFSTLPEDLYTVQETYVDGRATNLGDWLYTSLFPMPLCYVELLFSDPDGAPTGVYPVELPPPGQTTGGTVAPGGVDYTLRFTRRETWWSYYVMPQAPKGELHDLRIEHLPEPGSGADPRVRFLGPCKVRLPGGRRAWRFLSACPLPLEQRSRLHLRLHGRTARMTRAGVLVDRLPVASPQQVLPIPAQVAYEQARESLVSDPPPPRCQRLLDRLLDPGACRRRAGTGARSPPSDFSDIYVHV
ncbi:MAG TPA: hypothetical protein VM890_00845, partial [Longimicrobium sp.]|nr:hypothetical protein [Longimicrobium sp.]